MKAFSEVFPHFQATAAEQALVACLLVERVVVSDDMARLTVYVVSRSFAERAAFRALAEEMREQLFGKRNIQVEVRERFQLGGGIVVGPQVFDVAEARVRRRLEAFEEGAVGKHHGQVGSKFGHGYFPRFFRSLTSSSVR